MQNYGGSSSSSTNISYFTSDFKDCHADGGRGICGGFTCILDKGNKRTKPKHPSCRVGLDSLLLTQNATTHLRETLKIKTSSLASRMHPQQPKQQRQFPNSFLFFPSGKKIATDRKTQIRTSSHSENNFKKEGHLEYADPSEVLPVRRQCTHVWWGSWSVDLEIHLCFSRQFKR